MPPALAAPSTPPAVSPATTPSDAETRLDAVVVRVLQAEDVPAFSKAMQDLMAAIGRDDNSAQRLANVVLRDYALTVKVLRAANTAHYNRGGRPVQSATHALMLLGARTVRDLASALLLFEHYRRRSPGLKELMLLSLLTASTARAAAERCGAGVDVDAAHLAGMFRNLGEVLAAAHLGDEYATAICGLPVAGVSPDASRRDVARSLQALAAARTAAARAAIGCSYEELGAVIARHWGMPDGVRLGMRAEGGVGEDLCSVCTAFAHDFTTAVHRGDAVLAPQEMTRLLSAYGDRLRLTRESLKELAERAVDETREVFAAAGVRLDDLRLTRQVAAALLSAQDPQSDPAGAATIGRATAAASAAPAAAAPTLLAASKEEAVTGPSIAELRAQLAGELAAAAADPGGYDVARTLLLALEVVLRGGPFDRACFHAADASRREFRPRTGLGDGIDKLLASPGIPFDAEHGPSGPALRRGSEVHLAHGVRLTLADSQLLRRWDAVSVALFPIRIGGAVIGCVHADRHTAFAPPEASTTRYVRDVIRTLEQALEVRRSPSLPAGTVPPPTPPSAASPMAMSVKMDAVLRLLRGEPIEVVAAAVGASADAVATWRAEFLAGAAARLAGA